MLSIEDYEDKIKELNEKIDKMTNTFFQINVLSDKIIEYYYNEKNFEELITTKEFYYELKFYFIEINDKGYFHWKYPLSIKNNLILP